MRSGLKIVGGQIWKTLTSVCEQPTTKINDAYLSYISKRNNFDPSENFLLFCSPRGGSTWLMEMLSLIPKTAVLWEPLHLGQVSHFKKIGFSRLQYIPEDVRWPEAEGAFDKLFRGQVLNSWMCQMLSTSSFSNSDRMLIKFIRANAMLPWLTQRYNFKYPPIYFVRHPFAVAASWLQLKDWGAPRPHLGEDGNPYREYYDSHSDFLSTISSDAAKVVATWCLLNLPSLKNERNDFDWITIYYEHLLTNPTEVFDLIFQRWQIEKPLGIQSAINKVSRTAVSLKDNFCPEHQLSKWKSTLDAKQISEMMHVLEYFGVDEYDSGIYPRNMQ